ncbi:MAG: phosphatase PAP2 family protein [Candidatus Coatesbacteria bacterium]|nr:phosphatase PAP2 family protein [Candidatus Coatesbacteria bacterium]
MNRIIKQLIPFDYIVLSHLLILVVLQILWGYIHNTISHFLYINIILIGMIFVFIKSYNKWHKNPVIIFFRFFYPPLYVTFLYKNMNDLVHFFHYNSFDYLIDKIDRFFFLGYAPVLLLQKLVSPILTEIMHFGYMSYYFYMPVVAFSLFFFRKEEFPRYIFSIMCMYAVSFLMFAILPVQSPRFFYPEIFLPPQNGYWIKHLNDIIMDNQALCGGSLPSSHVGLAVISSIFYFRYNKTYGSISVFFTLLLCISTIYGRYHYFSDVLLGIIIGILFAYLSIRYHPEKSYRINYA